MKKLDLNNLGARMLLMDNAGIMEWATMLRKFLGSRIGQSVGFTFTDIYGDEETPRVEMLVKEVTDRGVLVLIPFETIHTADDIKEEEE